ncbi:hypothetical protein MJD09_07275, partial [bacterium]|nr:hypothetical protein [bacterium]
NLQRHYDLRAQIDKVVKIISERKKSVKGRVSESDFPEHDMIRTKMLANYQSMASLVKRHPPLRTRLAEVEKDLPPVLDLTPPSPPTGLRVSLAK